MEEKWLQDQYAPIFEVRLLLRCAYFWVYTVFFYVFQILIFYDIDSLITEHAGQISWFL